jgi:hypothetical protein
MLAWVRQRHEESIDGISVTTQKGISWKVLISKQSKADYLTDFGDVECPQDSGSFIFPPAISDRKPWEFCPDLK